MVESPITGSGSRFSGSLCLALGLVITASCATSNTPPVVTVGPTSLRLPAAAPTSVSVSTEDVDGDPIVVTAGAERGSVIVTPGGLRYTAPEQPGVDTITVQAHDGSALAEAVIPVVVDDPMAFSTPVLVSDTPGNAKTPTIAVDNEEVVHIAWHDFSEDPTAIHHAMLVDGLWTAAVLDLSPDKLIRPHLEVVGDTLHLFVDRYLDGDYAVLHSTWNGGVWSDPVVVGAGQRATSAVGPDGTLHAAWYDEGAPVHAWFDGIEWRAGDAIPVVAPYVYTQRMALVGTADGLQLGIPLSPGETSYDLNLFEWTQDGGWGPAEILFESPYLGCEEPSGAAGPDGVPRWVWAEQDPDDAWTFAIVEMASDDDLPRQVTTAGGFNGDAGIAIPLDGRPLVAWVTEEYAVNLARFPYDGEPLDFTSDGRGPRLAVDPAGYSHLTWFGEDGASEQIWYSTNRPLP